MRKGKLRLNGKPVSELKRFLQSKQTFFSVTLRSQTKQAAWNFNYKTKVSRYIATMTSIPVLVKDLKVDH